MPGFRRLSPLYLSIGAVLAATLLAGQASTAAAAPLSWAQAVEVKAPTGTSANFELNGVACTAVGSCTAVGAYVKAGLDHGAAVSESGGTWGQAIEVEAPVNTTVAVLSSVACTAPGTCVAVGYYAYQEGGYFLPMVATETGGKWAKAETIKLPANAAEATLSGRQSAELGSVACNGAEVCTAVGEYLQSGTRYENGMTVGKGAGGWEATELSRPPNATPDPEDVLSSISCPASGSCVATGTFSSEVGFGYEAMTLTEAGGEWTGTPVSLTLPSGQAGGVEGAPSISCSASGSCLTIGSYKLSGTTHNYLASATGGSWGAGVELPFPEGAGEGGEFLSLACPPVSGACAAVGYYGEALLDSGVGTSWSAAARPTLPSGGDSEIESRLTGASCPASGSCVAVGFYDTSNTAPRKAMTLAATGAPPAAEPITTHTTPFTGGPESPPAPIGTVALASTHLTVQTNGKTTIKLTCKGNADCTGKLELTVSKVVRRHGKKHTITKTIATSTFSIAENTSETVALKLSATGRSLLHSAHGKLTAKLTILTRAPTQHKTVELKARAKRR